MAGRDHTCVANIASNNLWSRRIVLTNPIFNETRWIQRWDRREIDANSDDIASKDEIRTPRLFALALDVPDRMYLVETSKSHLGGPRIFRISLTTSSNSRNRIKSSIWHFFFERRKSSPRLFPDGGGYDYSRPGIKLFHAHVPCTL